MATKMSKAAIAKSLHAARHAYEVAEGTYDDRLHTGGYTTRERQAARRMYVRAKERLRMWQGRYKSA